MRRFVRRVFVIAHHSAATLFVAQLFITFEEMLPNNSHAPSFCRSETGTRSDARASIQHVCVTKKIRKQQQVRLHESRCLLLDWWKPLRSSGSDSLDVVRKARHSAPAGDWMTPSV